MKKTSGVVLMDMAGYGRLTEMIHSYIGIYIVIQDRF